MASDLGERAREYAEKQWPYLSAKSSWLAGYAAAIADVAKVVQERADHDLEAVAERVRALAPPT